jgi:hypothetical protein
MESETTRTRLELLPSDIHAILLKRDGKGAVRVVSNNGATRSIYADSSSGWYLIIKDKDEQDIIMHGTPTIRIFKKSD